MSSEGINRLRDLLSQAVQCLNNAPGPSVSHSPSPTVTTTTALTATVPFGFSQPLPAPLGTSGSSSSCNILERNSLFHYTWPRTRAGQPCHSKPKKRSKIISQWHHDFICLAGKDQVKTPSTSERIKLTHAG